MEVMSGRGEVIQPIYVNNGTERQTKFYKADFFTNTLDMTP